MFNVTITNDNCSEYSNKQNGVPAGQKSDICATGIVRKHVIDFLNSKKSMCKTDLCVLKNPTFKYESGLSYQDISESLKTNFKPIGPRHDTKLLNNYEIDAVLRQWALANNTFYNHKFCLIDFHFYGGSLVRNNVIDIIQGNAPQICGDKNICRKCDMFACVVNTDKSTGKGKHWFAVFADMRGNEWSVEFFNSSGNPPAYPIILWVEQTLHDMKQYIADNNLKKTVCYKSNEGIVHQNKKTECGVYSLYFIRKRLENVPFKYFKENIISDDEIFKFRQYLFTENKY